MSVYGQPLSIAYLPGDVDLTRRYAGLQAVGVRRLYGPGVLTGTVGRFYTAWKGDGSCALILDPRRRRGAHLGIRAKERPVCVLTFATLADIRHFLRNGGLRDEGRGEGNGDGGARVPAAPMDPPPTRSGGAAQRLPDRSLPWG